jgi:hypothetical protein
VTVILPSIGAQISDKDNLRDKIDNISDDVNRYRSTLDTINLIDLLNPSSQPRGMFLLQQAIWPISWIH